MNSLLEVMAFRGKWEARSYIKFQGWTTRQAQVRMFSFPEHRWANRFGRVAVVKLGEDAGGPRYVFLDGGIRNGCFHGLPAQ